MFKIDILKGDVAAELYLDNITDATVFLGKITNGLPITSKHGNTSIFGKGKDSLVVTLTSLTRTDSSEIENIITMVNSAKGDDIVINNGSPKEVINHSLEEKMPPVQQESMQLTREALSIFNSLYYKYGVASAFKQLEGDIGYIDLRKRVGETGGELTKLLLAKDSPILTIKGLSNYLGIHEEEERGSNVLISSKYNLLPFTIFCEKIELIPFDSFKTSLEKGMVSLGVKNYSLITSMSPQDIVSWVIPAYTLTSMDDVNTLVSLGFKNEPDGLHKSINYSIISKLESIVKGTEERISNSSINSFKPIDDKPSDKELIAFKKVLAGSSLYSLAGLLTKYEYKWILDTSNTVETRRYKIEVRPEIQYFDKILKMIGVYVEGDIIYYSKGEQIIEKVITSRKQSDDRFNQCESLSDLNIIKKTTAVWFDDLVESQCNDVTGPITGRLVLGDTIPDDFKTLINRCNIRFDDKTNTIYWEELFGA